MTASLIAKSQGLNSDKNSTTNLPTVDREYWKERTVNREFTFRREYWIERTVNREFTVRRDYHSRLTVRTYKITRTTINRLWGPRAWLAVKNSLIQKAYFQADNQAMDLKLQNVKPK